MSERVNLLGSLARYTCIESHRTESAAQQIFAVRRAAIIIDSSTLDKSPRIDSNRQ
jgi:hypothetical protein